MTPPKQEGFDRMTTTPKDDLPGGSATPSLPILAADTSVRPEAPACADCQDDRGATTNGATTSAEHPNVRGPLLQGDPPADPPSQPGCANRKVNRTHLSSLMKFILANAGDGIERSELVASFFRLQRRYVGWYTDPCLAPRRKREHERRYRRAQPSITRTLKRLESRGLVQLLRHGKVVKEVRLTPEGKAIANALCRTDVNAQGNAAQPVGLDHHSGLSKQCGRGTNRASRFGRPSPKC